MYSVVLPENPPSSLTTIGADLYTSASHSQALFPARTRGTDASNLFDEEVMAGADDGDLFFSDDEQERNHKKGMKKKKNVNPARDFAKNETNTSARMEKAQNSNMSRPPIQRRPSPHQHPTETFIHYGDTLTPNHQPFSNHQHSPVYSNSLPQDPRSQYAPNQVPLHPFAHNHSSEQFHYSQMPSQSMDTSHSHYPPLHQIPTHPQIQQQMQQPFSGQLNNQQLQWLYQLQLLQQSSSLMNQPK